MWFRRSRRDRTPILEKRQDSFYISETHLKTNSVGGTEKPKRLKASSYSSIPEFPWNMYDVRLWRSLAGWYMFWAMTYVLSRLCLPVRQESQTRSSYHGSVNSTLNAIMLLVHCFQFVFWLVVCSYNCVDSYAPPSWVSLHAWPRIWHLLLSPVSLCVQCFHFYTVDFGNQTFYKCSSVQIYSLILMFMET